MTFQVIAVGVDIVFYGGYFIKLFSQKKKGIQTDQIGKGKAGFIKFIEITMKISAVLVLAAGVNSIFMGKSLSPVPVRAMGAAVSIAGTAIFIIAVLTMRDNWRAGVPETDKTELVTSGIYQISRNPAFLGFDLVYIGVLMMFFNWTLCLVTVFAVVMYHLQIVIVEETFLQTAFGDEYLEYKKKVRRYIGRKR